MGWYYNGQWYELPERPLKPPDCWRSKFQTFGNLDKKTALSAANTEDGKQSD